ncbi:MAG: DUF1697 domain-containing protein [Pseudolysinimonas sp.]
MSTSVILIRGINVGGKNPVAMSGLRELLSELGCREPETLLASGNALVDEAPRDLAVRLEAELPRRFRLHDERVRVLVLPSAEVHDIVEQRPAGFGDAPDTYHSDAIFLMGISVDEAMTVFDPREGVDRVWPGRGVIYSQRLSAQRTKSRLSKIIGTEAYASMTIRSWATTLKLDARAVARELTDG